MYVAGRWREGSFQTPVAPVVSGNFQAGYHNSPSEGEYHARRYIRHYSEGYPLPRLQTTRKLPQKAAFWTLEATSQYLTMAP